MRRPLPLLFVLAGRNSMPAAVRPAAAASAAGTWKLAFNTPNGSAVESTLKLSQDGEKLTGTLTRSGGMEHAIQDGTLKGSDLQFSITIDRDGEQRKVTFKGTLDGDNLKGTVHVGDMDRPFTGTRQAAAAPATAESLTGTWNLTIEAPNQTYRPTVTLAQEGEKLTGVLKTENGEEAKLLSGSAKSDAVEFVCDLDIGEMTLHLEFSGKKNDKGLKGNLMVNGMSVPWTGERAAKPAADPAKS
jgi:hypothetical protein